MAVRPPAFTCMCQLHGNVQVCPEKLSQGLSNMGADSAFFTEPLQTVLSVIGSLLVAYVKHSMHA